MKSESDIIFGNDHNSSDQVALNIEAGDEGVRLDQFLAQKLNFDLPGPSAEVDTFRSGPD